MSFTFNILDPGPDGLLINTCGGSHNFSNLLRYFGIAFYCHMMILSIHISTVCDQFSTGITSWVSKLALIIPPANFVCYTPRKLCL